MHIFPDAKKVSEVEVTYFVKYSGDLDHGLDYNSTNFI